MRTILKMTIKYICLILCVALCLCVAACNYNEKGKADGDKLSVVTSVFPAYDFARCVFGDRAEVTLLLPPGAEAHNYEPSPRDIIKIQSCDLFIYNGGVSDVWIDKILSSIDTKPKTLKMTDVCVPLVEGGHDGHNHEETHDEHVWLDIKNAVSIIKAINTEATNIDGENADCYNTNTKNYVEKLEALDQKFEELSADVTDKTLVFADRFPARYFTEGYGFEYISAFDGCADKAEPGSAKIAELIKNVKENHIPVVFYIEFSNQRIADSVCEVTGANKKLFHSCHNVSYEEFNDGITYLELMELNYKTVSEAFN